MTYRELRRALRAFRGQDDHAGAAIGLLLGLRAEGAHEGMTIRQLRWKLFADVGDDQALVDPGVIGHFMASEPIGAWDGGGHDSSPTILPATIVIP